MSMESKRLSRNSERLSSLALGVQALGTMMFTIDDNCGFSDDTRRSLGYLLAELGEVMVETLNDSTRAEIELALKNEGKK